MFDYKVVYNEWLNSSALTYDEKHQLIDIKSDDNDIKERFAVSLEFGTAGMRGVLGMGTNRMNRFTVIRATKGLAEYILNLGDDAKARGVVIAYDTRRFSTEFALDCAEVLNEKNIKVYLYENVRPVPMCSFAIRELNAVSGIMVTASHNPKQYNGYKVYGDDGAQMSPEATSKVVNYINKIDSYFTLPKKSGLSAESIKGKDNYSFENITIVGKTLDEKYYAAISKQMLSPEAILAARDIKIVYTPIHGTGNIPVRTMLTRMGIPVSVVPEQEMPDAEFTTVQVPNPEEPSALKLAVELAEKIGSNIVIGTDPDCDRMGIAVRDDNGRFILLNGNETGVLLMDYILSRNYQNGTLPSNSAVVKTIVTTKMADYVAKDYNTAVFDVLTGFKFIGEKIKEWEASKEYTFMFGFEESFGSLAGTHARDKDAVVSSMLVAEMACYYESIGSSVYNRLQQLYRKHGYFVETACSFAFKGLDGMTKMKTIMDTIRNAKPNSIADLKVLFISDYSSQITTFADGLKKNILLPKTNAMYFGLADDAWLCVRPSGTEPKLKIYIATRAKNLNEATLVNGALKTDAIRIFGL
ncbi:MAG: phospho-sugar mutase [Clostridia bacterium]